MSTLSGLLRDVVTLDYSCNMLLIPNIDACKLCTIGFSMTEKIRMPRYCGRFYKVVLILNATFASCVRARQWPRVYTPIR